MPILVGVSDTSVVESLQLARDVAEMGADAIVATTPYYLPLEETELVEYVRMLDKESPLPVVLYNMPRLTKQPFSLETLPTAMQFENVVGVKDSSGDMDYFKKLCDLAAERPDWSLLIGSETLLADAIKIGADGGVTGGANVAPALLVDVYESATNGDDERVKGASAIVAPARQPSTNSASMRPARSAASSVRSSCMGICNGRMADPHRSCDESQRKFVEQQLVKLALLEGDKRRCDDVGRGAGLRRSKVRCEAGTVQYS